ncbi:MAG: YccF domain-containing protein [Caulobacter sp.]|nr:YccF domain-containing protein [Caulobacter sp.]
MRLLLNILWFIFGGFISGMLWLLGGLILAVTIVGLPYTAAAWRIAGFAFWPFGKEIVSRDIITGEHDLGTGPLGFVLNVIWFLFAGWYIALSHLVAAFFEAITIIGLPFAFKDLQLAQIAFAPIGKIVVEKR